MRISSTIYSGILIASFAVSGLTQPPEPSQENKSGGTVDADRDRAGKTGHIGDGDRGEPRTTRYVAFDLLGELRASQFDLDKDRRISKNEFEQAFKRIDTNLDGYLSAEEFRQAGSKSGGNSLNPSDPHSKIRPKAQP